MYALEIISGIQEKKWKADNIFSGFHTVPLIVPGFLGCKARAVARELQQDEKG